MALPNKLNSAAPLGSVAASSIDDEIRSLKLALVDILGIADNTNIAAAVAEVTSSGLKNLRFQDASANPATAGYLQRNGSNLVFYDGSAANTLLTDATPWRGHIYRLYIDTYSGVSDTTNDVLISSGEASSDDSTMASRVLMVNDSNMIKQLDVAWAAGNNAGGRISGEALANGTWHIYMFKRSGGAIDFCFSQTTSPSLPDSGTKKRRVGSFFRTGGANIAVQSDGDYFFLNTAILDVNANAPGTSAVTRTMSVPTGIVLQWWGAASLVSAGAAEVVALLTPLTISNQAPSATGAPLGQVIAQTQSGVAGNLLVHTNTSGQIRSRVNASSADITLRLATWGWKDERDRTWSQ